jgi:hypothetical protein
MALRDYARSADAAAIVNLSVADIVEWVKLASGQAATFFAPSYGPGLSQATQYAASNRCVFTFVAFVAVAVSCCRA